jgi:hypothetical protein
LGGKVSHGVPKRCGRVRVDLVVRSAILSARSLRCGESNFTNGSSLAATSTHFIAQLIHGNSKHPRLKSPLFYVVIDLLSDRAKHNLRDLLRKFVIACIGSDKPMHTRAKLGHNGRPRLVVTSGGLLKKG